VTKALGCFVSYASSQRQPSPPLQTLPPSLRGGCKPPWQPSDKVTKALGCFVSYASSQRQPSPPLQTPLTPSLRGGCKPPWQPSTGY
ncbi:hypothetical protein, partial [Nitrosomonas sp.]|uniref:hypothetical protein n=1 Tax=Nitrosomonas sp. TaxID=42353 RepID=UPI0025D8B95B